MANIWCELNSYVTIFVNCPFNKLSYKIKYFKSFRIRMDYWYEIRKTLPKESIEGNLEGGCTCDTSLLPANKPWGGEITR